MGCVEADRVVTALDNVSRQVQRALDLDREQLERSIDLLPTHPFLALPIAAARAASEAQARAVREALAKLSTTVFDEVLVHAGVPEAKEKEAANWDKRASQFTESAGQADGYSKQSPSWLGETSAIYRDTATVCAAALRDMAKSMTGSAKFCRTVAEANRASFTSAAGALTLCAGLIAINGALTPFGIPVFWKRTAMAQSMLIQYSSIIRQVAQGELALPAVLQSVSAMNAEVDSLEFLKNGDFLADPSMVDKAHDPATGV